MDVVIWIVCRLFIHQTLYFTMGPLKTCSSPKMIIPAPVKGNLNFVLLTDISTIDSLDMKWKCKRSGTLCLDDLELQGFLNWMRHRSLYFDATIHFDRWADESVPSFGWVNWLAAIECTSVLHASISVTCLQHGGAYHSFTDGINVHERMEFILLWLLLVNRCMLWRVFCRSQSA